MLQSTRFPRIEVAELAHIELCAAHLPQDLETITQDVHQKAARLGLTPPSQQWSFYCEVGRTVKAEASRMVADGTLRWTGGFNSVTGTFISADEQRRVVRR